MELVIVDEVQKELNRLAGQDVYIHLETTNGAYASHHNESFFSAGAFIRNARVNFELGQIKGNGPYRIGLKLGIGWVYAEGITHFEVDDQQRLLMAGHDFDGKLAIALEISPTPFE